MITNIWQLISLMRGKDSPGLFFVLFFRLINSTDTELDNILPNCTFSYDVTFDL